MKYIPLTQGKFALVDDEDFISLSKFKGCAAFRNGTWHAVRGVTRSGKSFGIKMHSVIARAPIGMDIDHANINGLDNRRENLRIATRSQNQANRPKRHGKNPYKGVYTACTHFGNSLKSISD